MKELSLENTMFMYSRGWFPTALGFKSNKRVINNKEISLAIEDLSYATNRYNNADEDKIIPCIEEINCIKEKLDKLYEEAKNNLLAGINC